jgi:hypothetical protein
MRVVKVVVLLVLSFGALTYAQKSAGPEIDKDTKIKLLQNETSQMKLIWQEQQLENQLAQLRTAMNQIQSDALDAAKLDPKEWEVNPDTQTFVRKAGPVKGAPEAPAPIKKEPPK